MGEPVTHKVLQYLYICSIIIWQWCHFWREKITIKKFYFPLTETPVNSIKSFSVCENCTYKFLYFSDTHISLNLIRSLILNWCLSLICCHEEESMSYAAGNAKYVYFLKYLVEILPVNSLHTLIFKKWLFSKVFGTVYSCYRVAFPHNCSLCFLCNTVGYCLIVRWVISQSHTQGYSQYFNGIWLIWWSKSNRKMINDVRQLIPHSTHTFTQHQFCCGIRKTFSLMKYFVLFCFLADERSMMQFMCR